MRACEHAPAMPACHGGHLHAAQVRAGSFVYVCSTGDGAILQLSYPDMQLVRMCSILNQHSLLVHARKLCCSFGSTAAMHAHAQVRSMPLFSARDHPNTLAAADADGQHLWVVLHNLGDVSGRHS